VSRFAAGSPDLDGAQLPGVDQAKQLQPTIAPSARIATVPRTHDYPEDSVSTPQPSPGTSIVIAIAAAIGAVLKSAC
jgi:hypothetical protein